MSNNSSQFYTPKFLTGTALADLPPGLIARKIFPVREDEDQSGILPEIDPKKGLLRIRDLKASPGVAAPRIHVQVDKSRNFYCQKYNVAFPIPDEDKKSAKAETMLALNGARYTVETLGRYEEKLLVDALVAEFTGSSYTAAVGSTKWNAPGGTPLAEIKAKISTIEQRTGVSPTSLALDIAVLRGIFNATEVNAKIIQTLPPASQPTAEDQMATTLAKLLGIDEVVVAKNCFYNTATEDATASLSNIWGTYAFLYRKETPRVGFKGTGLTVTWNGTNGGMQDGYIVKQYREEGEDADIVKGVAYFDQLIADKNTGFLFSATIS
jgi:hypothetical protein